MSERKSKLGIAPEAINKAVDKMRRESGPESFFYEIQQEMKDKQPELYSFLASLGHNSSSSMSNPHAETAFIVGMTLSYDMLNDSLKELPLTRDQIMAVVGTMREYEATEIRNGVEHIVTNPNPWFDQIQSDSPIYLQWLENMTAGFGDYESGVSFLNGAFFTIMPFYKRSEAQELENKFFNSE